MGHVRSTVFIEKQTAVHTFSEIVFSLFKKGVHFIPAPTSVYSAQIERLFCFSLNSGSEKV